MNTDKNCRDCTYFKGAEPGVCAMAQCMFPLPVWVRNLPGGGNLIYGYEANDCPLYTNHAEVLKNEIELQRNLRNMPQGPAVIGAPPELKGEDLP